MKKLNDIQYKKLVDDITTIKEVLAKSKPTLQFIFLSVHFRAIALIAGISIIVFAGAYYFLVQAYGSFAAVPDLYRYIFYGAIFVDWLGLGYLKLRNWTRSVSSMDPDYTFKRAILEFITFRTIHTYIVFAVTTIFFVVYWIVTDQVTLIIPTLSISFGLIMNMIGNMTELPQYILAGSWMLVCGFIILAVGNIPEPLAIIGSFGPGFILFGIHSYFSNEKQG